MKTFDNYYPESENHKEIIIRKVETLRRKEKYENTHLLQLTDTATFHLSSISNLFVATNISDGLSFTI